MQDHTDFGTLSGKVLPDKSCKILQSPSQKVMQDLSGMISPYIVLHTKSCKIIEVFNPRSCLCDLTGIITRDLSRLFRHDLSRYSSKICSDFGCNILQDHELLTSSSSSSGSVMAPYMVWSYCPLVKRLPDNTDS